MKRYTDWYTFGWHGITIRLPTEWNLGKIGGDTRRGVSGYLRLDDAEIVRVEIEWRAAKPKAEVSIEKFVDRYTETLSKKAKAKGTLFAVQRQVSLIDTPEEHECFIWEADFRAYNFARRCSTCGRVVLLRVLTRPGEDASFVVPSIFASLTDHPANESTTYWGVYDLAFTLPAGLTLEEYSLKSGHLAFRFEKGRESRSGSRVVGRSGSGAGRSGESTVGGTTVEGAFLIDRLSLGTLLLKRYQSPIEWFDTYFHKALRDFRCVYDAIEVAGHAGFSLKGTPKRRWLRLLSPMPFVASRPRRYMSGRLWHCPDSDKIFFARTLTKREECVADRVITIVCHQENAEAFQRGNASISAETKPSPDVGR
ncbi:MAG: hypothetical protein HY709_07155 [Candidatus Latescibacteria bacterium]|nr:hypothetical protein [Candidatus Latescibacterota bacterium]